MACIHIIDNECFLWGSQIEMNIEVSISLHEKDDFEVWLKPQWSLWTKNNCHSPKSVFQAYHHNNNGIKVDNCSPKKWFFKFWCKILNIESDIIVPLYSSTLSALYYSSFSSFCENKQLNRKKCEKVKLNSIFLNFY